MPGHALKNFAMPPMVDVRSLCLPKVLKSLIAVTRNHHCFSLPIHRKMKPTIQVDLFLEKFSNLKIVTKRQRYEQVLLRPKS